jgi:transposase-like protein
MTETSKAHNAKVNSQRPAVNLVTLFEQYGDEDRARQALERLRWPEGVRCLRCGSDKVRPIQSVTKYRSGPKKGQVRGVRKQYDCSCGYQFSVTTGTVLHDTHLPLWKWFLATYLMTDAKKGVAALQLKRELGVSYEAAWYLCHRIRSAMVEATMGPLSGVVEIDETYVGGRKRDDFGGANKAMVMGALARDGAIRLKVESSKRRGRGSEIQRFVKSVVQKGTTEIVYTDGHNAYKAIRDVAHETVDHSAEEWVRGDVSTQGIESAWSLLKRSIVGSYHQLSVKHLQAYMDEFAFRFNNRENPFLFRDTLLALIHADVLPYAELTASVKG